MTSSAVAPRATTRDWIGLGVVLATTFMGQVDGFVVNVASPTIQRELPADFDQIQLVGAVYVFACAAGLMTGGRLGDRFGRRRVFLLGVAGFTLTSLACGLAPNAEVLIAARFAQGASSALMVPQVLAIVRATFHDQEQRARAVSAYGVVIGLGVIAGIAGGGVLVAVDLAGLGWRTIFLVNVPIGAAILLGGAAVNESRSETTTRVDAAGAGLTAFAVPLLLVPLILGPRAGWSPWIWGSAAAGAAAVVALAVQQRRTASPLYPPHVLAARGFSQSLLALGLFFAGNAGLFLVFTYHLQTGLGHDPLVAGLMFAPLGVGFVVGSAVVGRLTARLGLLVPVLGTVVVAACMLAAALAAQAGPGAQLVLLALLIGVVGLAQGVVVTPLVSGILSRISPDDAGAASGVATTVIQVGLALGFATVGICYQNVLGGTPGDGAFAAADYRAAFVASALLLAVVAVFTSLLCDRLRRLPPV